MRPPRVAVSTLALSAAVTLPLATLYLVVGAKLHQRSRLEGQPALAWFSAFWVGIGAYGFVEAAWMWSHLLGLSPWAFALLVLHVKVVATVAGFGGLVMYVLVIHGVGRRRLALVVAAYAILLALLETFYSWREPFAQEPGNWGMRLLYVRNDTQPYWTILMALMFVPPLIATLAYTNLLRFTRDPALRYRIVLVSASLLAFFLPVFLGWRAGGSPWWGAVEKALSAAMALGIVLALWPPPALHARLHATPEQREVAERALRARARELI